MEDNDIIPIDDAVNDFAFHLSNHPRTILSSGFGEGKTFFLEKCKHDLSNYIFITLYPVNYQVMSNDDIFDLVKRDILFQLFLHDILLPSAPISQAVALSFFLNNPNNYFDWVLSSVASLDYPELAAVKAISKATKFLKKAHSVFSKFCDEHNVEENNCIALWEKVESKGIYECDIITKLIVESIKKWKNKNPEKSIVLLVEDLDRIDPAHLFRILNVLSAHMDYSYKFGISPQNDSIYGNKFGFDNIVCVLDYDNLISIFRHFYGEFTSWNGYISKFSTKGYFRYSLSEQKANYFFNKASELCKIDISLIKSLIKEDVIKKSSMRIIKAALDDIPSQISPISNYNRGNVIKEYPDNLLRFFVLLRRMNVSDNDIISNLMKVVREEDSIKELVMPFYFLMTNEVLQVVSFGEKINGYLIRYDFTQNNSERNFKAYKSRLSGYDNSVTYPSFEKILRFMLSKIGK